MSNANNDNQNPKPTHPADVASFEVWKELIDIAQEKSRRADSIPARIAWAEAALFAGDRAVELGRATGRQIDDDDTDSQQTGDATDSEVNITESYTLRDEAGHLLADVARCTVV